MSSEFGKSLKVTLFGESHGPAVGAVVQGLPAGEPVDLAELQRFLDRRRGGKSPLTTARQEADEPCFLSGLLEGKTCGTPLCAVLENQNQQSRDYEALKTIPRPGHGDYPAMVKWQGQADLRGGGHGSGRLTAPLCVAGGIAKQLLQRRGICVGAHLLSVGGVWDKPFPLVPTADLFENIEAKALPVLDDRAGDAMEREILMAKAQGNSVGGRIQCAVTGLPVGLGSPRFEGVESRLAQVLFGIPGLKGLEFGSGFAASDLRGSENNDPYVLESGQVRTASNHAGGVLGGLTTGMPLVFQAAMKPTPSIGAEQQTVDLAEGRAVTLSVPGRHDPCIALRAVPVVEAAAACVVLDLLLEEGLWT